MREAPATVACDDVDAGGKRAGRPRRGNRRRGIAGRGPGLISLRAVATLAVAALLAAACGIFQSAPVGPQGPQAVQCEGLDDAACQAVIAQTGAANRRATQILVRCMVPVCTAAEGDAQITLFFPDGSTETSSHAWASAPQPAPVGEPPEPGQPFEPICLGVPLQQCRDMADIGSDPEFGQHPIASVTVRCKGICTPLRGEGTTIIKYLDGTPDQTVDWGYEGG
jgi:hypothetical protein